MCAAARYSHSAWKSCNETYRNDERVDSRWAEQTDDLHECGADISTVVRMRRRRAITCRVLSDGFHSNNAPNAHPDAASSIFSQGLPLDLLSDGRPALARPSDSIVSRPAKLRLGERTVRSFDEEPVTTRIRQRISLRAEQLCTHSVQSYAETSKNTKSSEKFTVEKKEQNVNNITE